MFMEKFQALKYANQKTKQNKRQKDRKSQQGKAIDKNMCMTPYMYVCTTYKISCEKHYGESAQGRPLNKVNCEQIYDMYERVSHVDF